MSRKFWISLFLIGLPIQTAALVGGTMLGKHLADEHSYSKGMCKVDGLWNTAEMCREKGVTGNVRKNADGTYSNA